LVRLRRLEKDDADSFFPHWNNYNLKQYLPTPLPTSYDEMVKFIESANDSFASRKGFTFGIETLDSNKLVGIVNLVNVKTAERVKTKTFLKVYISVTSLKLTQLQLTMTLHSVWIA